MGVKDPVILRDREGVADVGVLPSAGGSGP